MSTVSAQALMVKSLSQEIEKIFREHAQLMFRSAFSVTGSCQDAEDVLQNVFLGLLQRKVPLEFKTNPRAYLYRAAVNRALNVVQQRNRQTFADDVKYLPSPASVDEEDPAEELRHHLLDAIAQLRPRAVEILILHYEHNYSDAEIAKMLGKSRGTIAVTLYRARARLKRLMSRASERSVPSAESVPGVERRTAKS